MAKREGSFTFTFSKRNQDVKEIIESKKENDTNFVVTDYMCEAVRFYELHKDKFDLTDMSKIEKLIDELIVKKIGKPNENIVPSDESTVTVNYLKAKFNGDINNIDDSCIDED